MWIKRCVDSRVQTKVEVFVGKEVREAVPDGEGKRARRCNKKARDFTQPFIHKCTLLSIAESKAVGSNSKYLSEMAGRRDGAVT